MSVAGLVQINALSHGERAARGRSSCSSWQGSLPWGAESAVSVGSGVEVGHGDACGGAGASMVLVPGLSSCLGRPWSGLRWPTSLLGSPGLRGDLWAVGAGGDPHTWEAGCCKSPRWCRVPPVLFDSPPGCCHGFEMTVGSPGASPGSHKPGLSGPRVVLLVSGPSEGPFPGHGRMAWPLCHKSC